MNIIDVIAVAGIKVPMEDKPRNYITDAESVSVEDSPYYQRRIADGDLLRAPAAAGKKPAARAVTTTGE